MELWGQLQGYKRPHYTAMKRITPHPTESRKDHSSKRAFRLSTFDLRLGTRMLYPTKNRPSTTPPVPVLLLLFKILLSL